MEGLDSDEEGAEGLGGEEGFFSSLSPFFRASEG